MDARVIALSSVMPASASNAFATRQNDDLMMATAVNALNSAAMRRSSA